MNQLPVRELPVNSYIDAPVFLDESYILLAPDIPVSPALVKRLGDWEFREVFTSGSASGAPSVETGAAPQANLNKNLKEEETSNEVFKSYRQILAAVSQIFERFKTKDEIKIADTSDLVKQLIALVKAQPRYALNLPDIETPEQGFLVSHAVKTSLLAVALAEFLKLPPHRVIEIGIAGLLHMIGMMRIPSEIYLSDRQLDPKERQMIMAQPILGFRALKAAGFPIQIAVAILEHHERIDGSGYPRKLTGDKLSPYGKILAVASSYVAAVSERPFRQARDGHSGIMDLLRDMGKKYDESVLRALVFTLSVYPIGTHVELGNRSRGVVVSTNPETPKLPTVRLLVNAKGEPFLDQPVVQVEESGELQIVRPLSAEEIGRIRENKAPGAAQAP